MKQRSKQMIEAETNRNVSEAIQLFLKDAAAGVPQHVIVDGLSSAGIDPALSRSVINSLINSTWIIRRGDRLYLGSVK